MTKPLTLSCVEHPDRREMIVLWPGGKITRETHTLSAGKVTSGGSSVLGQLRGS